MNQRQFISGLFWLAISIFVNTMAIKLGVGAFSSLGPGFLFSRTSPILGALAVVSIIQSLLGGRAGPALDIAAFGSFIAGTLGVVGLVFFATPLSRFAHDISIAFKQPSKKFMVQMLYRIQDSKGLNFQALQGDKMGRFL